MQKPLLLLPAVVFLALGAAYNPGSPSQEGTAPKSSKAANDALARGKKIYDIDCALCHGANGDGKTDLAKDMQLSLSDFTFRPNDFVDEGAAGAGGFSGAAAGAAAGWFFDMFRMY